MQKIKKLFLILFLISFLIFLNDVNAQEINTEHILNYLNDRYNSYLGTGNIGGLQWIIDGYDMLGVTIPNRDEAIQLFNSNQSDDGSWYNGTNHYAPITAQFLMVYNRSGVKPAKSLDPFFSRINTWEEVKADVLKYDGGNSWGGLWGYVTSYIVYKGEAPPWIPEFLNETIKKFDSWAYDSHQRTHLVMNLYALNLSVPRVDEVVLATLNDQGPDGNWSWSSSQWNLRETVSNIFMLGMLRDQTTVDKSLIDSAIDKGTEYVRSCYNTTVVGGKTYGFFYPYFGSTYADPQSTALGILTFLNPTSDVWTRWFAPPTINKTELVNSLEYIRQTGFTDVVDAANYVILKYWLQSPIENKQEIIDYFDSRQNQTDGAWPDALGSRAKTAMWVLEAYLILDSTPNRSMDVFYTDYDTWEEVEPYRMIGSKYHIVVGWAIYYKTLPPWMSNLFNYYESDLNWTTDEYMHERSHILYPYIIARRPFPNSNGIINATIKQQNSDGSWTQPSYTGLQETGIQLYLSVALKLLYPENKTEIQSSIDKSKAYMLSSYRKTVSDGKTLGYFEDPLTGIADKWTLLFSIQASTSANLTEGDSDPLFNILYQSLETTSSSLVGYWKMDEESGSIITDSSDLGNNGNIINLGSGVNRDTGKYDKGLKFLGTNGYVNIPNSSSLDFNRTSNLTISFWLDLESENRQDIINSGWWWDKDGFDIEYGVNSGYLAIRGCFNGIDVSDHQYFYFKPYIGYWTHLVFDFDTDMTRLYVNGMKVVEKNLGGSLCFNKNKAVKIGGTHYYLNGSIDEVKIFLPSLSEQEIQRIDPIIHDNQTLELSYGTLSDTIVYENLSYNERGYNISLKASPEDSSRNVMVCTNIFDLISMKDVFPEGPQNIPDISNWNVKIFKNSIDDTPNWNITPSGFCKDDKFLSSDYRIVARIEPRIKILVDYNKIKSISNMSYGVQLSGSSSFGYDWLTGGPNQSLWNLTKKLNFSTLRVFDLGMRICESWDSINHQCSEWNWTTADMAINSIITLGMEPLMANYINFYQPWEPPGGIPGMDIHWNNTSYPNPDDFANYISEIVRHYNIDPYHYNIKYWEIINEPPVRWATQENLTAFVKLYNKSREKIKAVDPSALTGVNDIGWKPFFDFLVNYSDDIDFGTIHPYEGSSGRNNATLCLNNPTYCSPPNDQYSYYTDSTLLSRASSFDTLSSYDGLKQLRDKWKEKRGKDLETFNSESDINFCGPYLCDPRQNNIMAAVWYATKCKTMILDGSTLSIYFQLGSYNSNGNIYGGFGHALVKSSYPYEGFPGFWSNYLLANYIPKESIIYDSASDDSSIVDSLAVKTANSNNILLINKMNISTDVRLPILGFGIKNATLYVLDQDSYKWYYNNTLKKVVITYSNISSIDLPKDNVQNIRLNGYSVAILQVFSLENAPYIKSINEISDLTSVVWSNLNFTFTVNANSGTMSIVKVFWPYSLEPIVTHTGGSAHSYSFDPITNIETLNATHTSPVTWNLQVQAITTTTTIPTDTQPPQWGPIFVHNPIFPLPGQDVLISVDWSDDTNLHTVIISENATNNQWTNHTCDMDLHTCSEGVLVSTGSFVAITGISSGIVILTGSVVLMVATIKRRFKANKFRVAIPFIGIIVFIILLSIILFPEVQLNIRRIFARLGIIIRPMEVGPITFTHNIDTIELSPGEIVGYKSYANDTSGNNAETIEGSFTVATTTTTTMITTTSTTSSTTSTTITTTTSTTTTTVHRNTETKLYLNGTEGNFYYINNTYANFTAEINASGTAYLDANITGWTINSGSSPFTQIISMNASENNTYYNITGYFLGNETHNASFQSHYAIVYVSTTTADTTSPTTTVSGNGGGGTTTTIRNITINTTTTTVNITTSSTTINTTIPVCKSSGNSCNFNSECCSGYCCDGLCSDVACEKEGSTTKNILIALSGITGAVAGIYYFYVKKSELTKTIAKIVAFVSASILGIYYVYTKYIKHGTIPVAGIKDEYKYLQRIVEDFKKKGYDVSVCEKELKLADNAMRQNLIDVATSHLKTVRKILENI